MASDVFIFRVGQLNLVSELGSEPLLGLGLERIASILDVKKVLNQRLWFQFSRCNRVTLVQG